ncbi:MAG: tetratricopeptide repeat protein [Bacteroidota bacterium]
MKIYTYSTLLCCLSFLVLFTACGDGSASDNGQAISEQRSTGTGNPAIDALSEKIKGRPDDATLYADRGAAYYDNDGYDEAIFDLQRAIQLDSLNPDYFHLLADVYMDYFKSRLALATMEEAQKRFPERIPTLLKLCEFQHILKQYEESMKTIDQVLKLDPQNAEAYFMFGLNFRETGDPNRAINSFQEAVSIDPDLVDAWINLGQLYSDQNSPLAKTFFDNAIEVAPENILALHAKANYLSSQDDLTGAVAIYKKINILDPQYEDAFFNTGLLYLDLDSIAEAKAHFDMALKVSPTFIRAYYYRGVAYELQEQYPKAKADYEQALRMAPNYEDAQAGVERIQVRLGGDGG